MKTYEYMTRDQDGNSILCSERFECIEKCVGSLRLNMNKVDLNSKSATIAKFSGAGKVKILSICTRVEGKLMFRSA